MFFSSWLRNRTTTPRANRSPARRQQHARFRPALEMLEDRAVPAMLNVTTTLDVLDPNDGVLSLREAVIQANASPGANTIVVPAGTYTLAMAGTDDDAALTGDLDLAGHLTVEGAGAGATVIDAAGLDRVFHVLGDAHVTLSGMTIQGGGGPGMDGGGIANALTAALTVSDCIVTGNSSYSGGGIYNIGTATIRNSTVSDNAASHEGGGIINYGTMTIYGSVVFGNSAGAGGGIYNWDHTELWMHDTVIGDNVARLEGGGIASFGALTANNSDISGNSAEFGGGVYNGGTARLNNSTAFGNSARDGGGIYNFSLLTMNNSTLFGNSAERNGGGIFNGGIPNWTALTLANSTLTENSAGGVGGGLYIQGIGAMATVVDSAVTGNSASLGGGIYIDRHVEQNGALVFYGTLTVRNSTVLGNVAELGADVYNAGLLFVYDSLIGDRFDA
ncbi:MAG: hypothetical protein HYS12_17915 [Planctomycetes bacterium]|nr:hypothetical protein [Planctomycetota bacterium]